MNSYSTTTGTGTGTGKPYPSPYILILAFFDLTKLLTYPGPHGLALGKTPVFGSTQIVTPIDEFTTRVLEEMDFVREVKNIQLFANMYCHKRGSSLDVQVVVPEVITPLCTRRLIIMEFIEGKKLTDICLNCDDSEREIQENLDLVRRAIEMTLSQLLTDGLLHSDPHESNLVKVKSDDGKEKYRLGYLDFGLVSKVPQRFQGETPI